jgi:hypothetical protein
MDGGGNQERLYNVQLNDHKLVITGMAGDGTMDLVQGAPTLFSASKTNSSVAVPSGYCMIFNTNDFQLIHSTYYGGFYALGPGTNEITTTVSNGFNEMFAFGNTLSSFGDGPNDIGIPIINNQVEGSYFQSNLNSTIEATDGFGFKFCFDGTPLNSSSFADKIQGAGFELYPNPLNSSGSNNSLTLQSRNVFSRILVYDIYGRILQDFETSPSKNFTFNSLMPAFSTGVYIVEISHDSFRASQRLVVIQ